MIKNFLKTTIRVLFQNKVFSIINIMGLAIGIACCIFIALYINHEVSYDRFHPNSERTHLLTVSMERGNEVRPYSPISSPQMGLDLIDYIPEIESILRIGYTGGNYKIGDKMVSSGSLLYVDSTLWNILNFELIKGDPKSALSQPFSMVVSEELAHSFFGDENPMGKVILKNGETPYTITGIVKNCPTNTRYDFNGFVSFSTLYKIETGVMNEWDGNFSFRTLLKLSEGTDTQEVIRKANEYADNGINQKLSKYNVKIILGLQALEDIHLYTDLEYEKPGVIKTLYTLSAIALFILFIAGFNFVNLTTARSTRRAKEIGIRMTVGAAKKTIRFQFIGESILLAIISALVSLLIVELLMPWYNNLLGLKLSLYNADSLPISLSIPVFIIIFGVLAGLYPALFISSFKPIRVLKADFGGVKPKASIRNILVTCQFVVSSLLIIATSTIYFQINYLKNKDLGFNSDNLLMTTIMGENKWDRAYRIMEEIDKLPEFTKVVVANQPLGRGYTKNGYQIEGIKDNVLVTALSANHEFLEGIDAEIIKGRYFSTQFKTDSGAAIVNEAFVRLTGWDDPIGKKVVREKQFNVIGVVKDFHFKSLHNKVEPLIVFLPFDFHFTLWSPVLHIRFQEGKEKEGFEKLNSIWSELEGSPLVSYSFVNDIYANHYKTEDSFMELLIYFSILAVFISCLGLMGLSSFILENRLREIGIRKVLGSGIMEIITKFSIDFTRWALLGTIISWPLAWYFSKEWLSNFAYRIETPWITFLVSSLITLFISLATILLQTYKAAQSNPIDTLKYE